MKDIKNLLKSKISEFDKTKKDNSYKYVNHEFQDYGLRLAKELNDVSHKSLYIRYAKEVPRALIESARAFVMLNYEHKPKKGKIFMWKLTQELYEYKKKHPEFKLNLYKRKSKKSQVNSKNSESTTDSSPKMQLELI